MPDETPIPDLQAWLRHHDDATAELVLGRAQVERLALEFARLKQSGDRLRKQNKKLRGKLTAHKLTLDDVTEA